MSGITPQAAILGIDAGGTFTDFVLLTPESGSAQLKIHKVLSTPEAPELAILQGIEELGLGETVRRGGLRIIHGSTVATNAALEGNGARTAFITNRGFGDMLTLGRQTRPFLYRLEQPPRARPVESELCLEVGGRLAADGELLDPLTSADLQSVTAALENLQPEAVAINLLFSFLDDRYECKLEEAIRASAANVFVSRSSAVLPEYREYERGVATWLNASLGPVVSRYLTRLESRLENCPLTIMQSSGETISAPVAASRAVNLLLSGPAAGLAAIRHLGQQLGESRFISFDMGGTSTDVALVDGELKITNEGHIAGFPVAVPMVDMHTIGAGGGSVAFVDSGGMLQVGPRSAGASPGPACYGKGGAEVTVTDANLVLGRIPADAALAGSFKLDSGAAGQAMELLAEATGLDAQETALGIVRIANENMANALRMISVQRGHDPGEFILACFGGAGGLHVCALADAMGMTRAIVPANAGVLSALGMLVAPQGRQFSRTVRLMLREVREMEIEAAIAELERQGTDELVAEGLPRVGLCSETSVDLCYFGQSSTLNLPWLGKRRTEEQFHRQHDERYGFALDRDVEIVNLRARITHVRRQSEQVNRQPARNSTGNDVREKAPCTSTPCHSEENAGVPVFRRELLGPDAAIAGPAVITELSATTYLEAGWQARLDDFGNLRLERVDLPEKPLAD